MCGRFSDLEIIKYNRFDFKIYNYIKKLKEYFKEQEKNYKIRSDIDFIDRGLSRIESNFHQEIRAKKLRKLK